VTVLLEYLDLALDTCMLHTYTYHGHAIYKIDISSEHANNQLCTEKWGGHYTSFPPTYYTLQINSMRNVYNEFSCYENTSVGQHSHAEGRYVGNSTPCIFQQKEHKEGQGNSVMCISYSAVG